MILYGRNAEIIVFSMILWMMSNCPGWCGQALSVGGQAQVQLQFRINIPQILYLQVGTDGSSIDVIDFNVTNVPGTGRVQGNPQEVPVRVKGLIPRGQTLTLSVDSSQPLKSGSGSIPFQTVSWEGRGSFTRGTFNGAPQQRIGRWDRSGAYEGTFFFSFSNQETYPAGTYEGRVIYTLAVP